MLPDVKKEEESSNKIEEEHISGNNKLTCIKSEVDVKPANRTTSDEKSNESKVRCSKNDKSTNEAGRCLDDNTMHVSSFDQNLNNANDVDNKIQNNRHIAETESHPRLSEFDISSTETLNNTLKNQEVSNLNKNCDLVKGSLPLDIVINGTNEQDLPSKAFSGQEKGLIDTESEISILDSKRKENADIDFISEVKKQKCT